MQQCLQQPHRLMVHCETKLINCGYRDLSRGINAGNTDLVLNECTGLLPCFRRCLQNPNSTSVCC